MPPDLYSICNFMWYTHSTACTRKKKALETPRYLQHSPLCQILIQIKYFCTSTCAGKQGSRNSSMCQPLSLPASEAGGKATASRGALQAQWQPLARGTKPKADSVSPPEKPCRATATTPPLPSMSPATGEPPLWKNPKQLSTSLNTKYKCIQIKSLKAIKPKNTAFWYFCLFFSPFINTNFNAKCHWRQIHNLEACHLKICLQVNISLGQAQNFYPDPYCLR